MAKPTLENLLRTHTETDFGPKPVLSFMQDIGMPLPGPGQFLESNQGAIIAHPTAGVVLRIERDKMALDHPLTAPVIGRFTAGAFELELVVGGRTRGLGNRECAWVNQNLRRSGAYWRDTKPEDLMRLPLATKEHPHGLPVIMDREFIYETTAHSLRNAAARLFGLKPHEPQLEDFGVSPSAAKGWRQMMTRLTGALRDSFDDDSGRFDRQKIAAFWQLAEDYTSPNFNMNMPFLFRGWEETDTSPRQCKGLYGQPFQYHEKDGQFALAMQSYSKDARHRPSPL